MTTIYGLREVGSEEIRYVGYTNQPIAKRLLDHQRKARGKSWPYGVAEWMRSAGEVEIVCLRTCPRKDTHKAERQWVKKLHGEGHRLTNSHLMPRSSAGVSL